MAKKDRTGNRKTRDQRKQFKVLELGYYLIVTDTEATERCFFTGLHQAMPEDVRNKLVIKVIETKTRTMIDKCMELMAYDAQYRIPWIVFDRDQVQGFDDIIAEAVNKGIQVGWSNPCFEIWMYAYFGSMPAIQDSWQPVPLTRKESSVLEYLLLHQGRPVSQEELMEHVWDGRVDAFSNSIRVHISALRKKLRTALGYDPIRNRIGEGYEVGESEQ